MAAIVSAVTLPEASRTARPAVRLTASRSWSGVMLSSRIEFDAELQRFFELFQAVDFDFDVDHVAGVGAGGFDGVCDAAGGHDVVVLDQDAVVEAEAVIVAAAAAHGVFLEGAQARRRFAGADDARFRALARVSRVSRWRLRRRRVGLGNSARRVRPVRIGRAGPSTIATMSPRATSAAVGRVDRDLDRWVEQAERGAARNRGRRCGRVRARR